MATYRGPVGNDKNATFRYEVQICCWASIDDGEFAGWHHGTTVSKDDKGNTNIDLKSTGTSGFKEAGVSGAPTGDIVTNLNLVVTPDGKVGIDGGE
jgi:hypothetical protein